jgi:hypothetical protein
LWVARAAVVGSGAVTVKNQAIGAREASTTLPTDSAMNVSTATWRNPSGKPRRTAASQLKTIVSAEVTISTSGSFTAT